jgi:hypothetical protein
MRALLLVHGNRLVIVPYADDERFLVLGSGGRLEYRLAGGVLTIVRPAARLDIWGVRTISGDYKRGR